MYSKVSGSETYSLGCRFSWFVVRRHLESQGLRMLRWEKKGFSTICRSKEGPDTSARLSMSSTEELSGQSPPQQRLVDDDNEPATEVSL
eukprot:symbB.v1.2.006981.t1/scaffold411.1/size210109/4